MWNGIVHTALAGGILAFFANCQIIIGPSCLTRSGTVTTVSGVVAAGAIAVHEVPYGTDGSENDLSISWTNQHTADGPRLHVYATRTDCVNFVPPVTVGQSATSGACASVSTPPAPDAFQTSLVVMNGHGNPDVLGPAARYKLWVVGDGAQRVSYTISITWFFGTGC